MRGNHPNPLKAWARSGALGHELTAEVQLPVSGFCDRPRFVFLLFAGSEEMDDAMSARMQELRDQATMATPPQRFGTHEASRLVLQSQIERRSPSFGAHASGVTAEPRNADAAEELLMRLAGKTTAELDRVAICDTGPLDNLLEGGGLEPRVASRTREASNIDQRSHACIEQHRDELFGGPRAMSDGPYGHHATIGRVNGTGRRSVGPATRPVA
jgi:hypothetical protein